MTTVAAADALLRVPAIAAWHPEVVLRLGRPWVSKVLGGWLAGLPSTVTQVLVDPEGVWSDPDRMATTVVGCDPTALCHAVVAAVGGGGAVGSEWLAQWAVAEAAAQAALDAVLADRVEITEPGVARAVAAGLPEGATLFTSSSMPVRDLEWYGAPRAGLRVLANRGANGIDGVTSTAIGVALSGCPVVALLGDLAFLYDAGALLWAAGRGVSLTLVVVDNDGGGIFSFLPQASALSAEVFERLWATPHGTDLAAVASAYGIPPPPWRRGWGQGECGSCWFTPIVASMWASMMSSIRPWPMP
jgi:2-succinyl-5-enolpyruvyl-6-hydroxy-3-cyclohexene-1-carboxylate synthase